MLDEDKVRIAEEEMIRERARQILKEETEKHEKEQESRQSPGKKAWAFLQTTLGTGLIIWFLTSVLVATISWSFTQWQANRTADRQRIEAISQINHEMAARLHALNAVVDAELAKLQHQKSYRPSSESVDAIYAYMIATPKDYPMINIFPQFNNVSMLGLANELEAITAGNERVKSGARALTTVFDMANKIRRGSSSIGEPSMEEVRNLIIQTHRTLNFTSLPQEWRM